MIKAVLLDMDNTLLHNPDRDFARAFLSRFDQHMQDTLHYANAAQLVRQSIQHMNQTRKGDETNFALVLRIMQAAMNHHHDTIQAAFDSFYREQYPALCDCVRPVSGAADLIYTLREKGYIVVIATNPIYPETGIKQRMAWGDLPTDDHLYALVTSADNMHFAKPDPAYYGEILGRIGIEPHEALMVGDSLRNDIQPAQRLGIHTFHIHEETLENFADKFAALVANLPPHTLHPDMIEPQLRGSIGALFGLLNEVQPAFWDMRPDANTLSIAQILSFLVTAEDTEMRPRLEKTLQEANPIITASKLDEFKVESCDIDGFSIAQTFQETRLHTLRFLQTLAENDWYHPAQHAIFGKTSLLEMAAFTAQHDRRYLKQLRQMIEYCQQ